MNQSTLKVSSWAFGINDSSLIAWLIVIAYIVTAVLCWRSRANAFVSGDSTKRMLWLLLSFFLILLCVNKQLDLHKWCMELGRDLLMDERNYSPWLLVGIVACMALIGVSVWLLSVSLLRKSNSELRCAYFTLFSLLGLQVLRFLPGPISGLLLLHVITEQEGLLHIHTIELLELGSLLVIGYFSSASLYRNRVVPDHRADD